MPLQSLTNSPACFSQPHRKSHPSSTSEFPTSSNSSGVLPFVIVDDGIYNAQRVASDHESSILDQHALRSVYQSNHDRTGSIDIRLRRRQALSDSGTIPTKQPPIHHPLTEIKANRHCRGWSLNDLDCVAHTNTLVQNLMLHRSPSSNEALEAATNVTAYPHLAPGPPPYRKPTPDGIPSFGTREAQELRLVPPSRLHRLEISIRKRFRPLELVDNATDGAMHAPHIERPRCPPSERPRFEGPADVLRRVSGMVRPVSVADLSRRSHRSALPRSVRVASVPGDLTMAEDGSHVRGRFGNGVSGHGVGQRTMDLHPLARGQERSTIEEEVRAINKACDRENLREQDQSRSGAVELRSISRGENDNLRILGGYHAGSTEERRREPAGLRTSLKIRQGQLAGPSVTFDQVRTFQPSHSRNSSSTVYNSARARNNASNMRSSGSETTRPPRMVEPASYDAGRPRSAAQRSTLRGSTREGTLEEQENEQASQEARQPQGHKSDTEAC